MTKQAKTSQAEQLNQSYHLADSASPVSQTICEVFSTHVESVIKDKCIITSGNQKLSAKVASSCFLQPSQGDYVLASSSQRGEVYILSVLNQKNVQSSSLLMKAGDVKIESDNIALNAKKNLNMTADQGKFVIKTVQWVSNLWQGFFEKFFRHAGHSHHVSSMSTETTNAYMLHVDGGLQQRASTLDIKVDSHFQVQSENSVIQASDNLVVPTKQTSFV